MTEWNDILENDIDSFMELGSESITYRKAGGTTREITAIVDRNANDYPAGGQMGLRNNIVITVRNNVLTGVTSDELDIGADKFRLSAKEDATEKYFNVARLVKHDAGALTLELRY